MQSSVMIRIDSTTKQNRANPVKNRKISDFLKLVKSHASTFSRSPFTNAYKIKGGSMDHPDFWNICGKPIKSLEMKNVSFDSADAIRHALFQSCPDMEKLTLQNVCIHGGYPLTEATDWNWVDPKFPQLKNLKSLEAHSYLDLHLGIPWKEIFSYIPFIQDLNLKNISIGCNEIFKSLRISRAHDNQAWNIKRLSFQFEEDVSSPEVLPALTDGTLALEELNIYSISDPVDTRSVRSILTGHASSLRKLSLQTCDDLRGIEFLPLPPNQFFLKLEELNFASGTVDFPISFLRFLPNLRRLKLKGNVQYDFAHIGNLVMGNCTELSLPGGIFDVETFQNLKRCMPNVKILEMNFITNERFAWICESWPNLVSLNLQNCMMNDCGISGLDDLDVFTINRVMDDAYWRPKTAPRINLSSLTNLESLKISTMVLMEGCQPLGYCAAVCGVQKLPRLKHLDISKCLVVGEIWDKLAAQFPM